MKLKKGFTKHACIDKLLNKLNKILHKLAKNIKLNKSNKTMEILQDKSNMSSTTLLAKSNMRLSILNDMGVIIPDPNTMENKCTASSSSPCPSSTEATILKSTFHGH